MPIASVLATGDEAAWVEFITLNQQRWWKFARRCCGGQLSWDEVEDVCQDAMVRALGEFQRHSDRIECPARYVFGIIRKLVQETIRRKLHGSAQELPDLSGTSTPSTGLARVELLQNAKRAVKVALERVRASVRAEAQDPKRATRTAPLLHWAWLDLATNEIASPTAIASLLMLPDASAASRLRDSALDRVGRELAREPAWTCSHARLEDAIRQDGVFRIAWAEERYGCPDELLFDIQVDALHESDAKHWRIAHLEQVRCAICRPSDDPRIRLDPARIEALARSTSRRFRESGGG